MVPHINSWPFRQHAFTLLNSPMQVFIRQAMIRFFLLLVVLMPLASAQIEPAQAQGTSQLSLSAVFTGENRAIGNGLVWRVFRQENAEAEAKLITQSNVAAPVFPLPPGEYVIHLAYGLAFTTRKVLVGQGTTTERVPLAAGALSVRGSILDQSIPANRLQVSVFIPQPGNSEGQLVTSTMRPGEVLRLPEGTYHVVSSYGDSNSIVRADIRINSGKTTEANMRHRAATITLKLVSRAGGEARANTAWSVLTPGGDVIREALGAFPSMTLLEGDYLAIARNDGRVFQGEFKVRTGLDRDVEVVAGEGQPIGTALPSTGLRPSLPSGAFPAVRPK
jgi:hypothetical protein